MAGVGVLLVVVFVLVFFRMPYSKTKQEFAVLSQRLIEESSAAKGVFSEPDIEKLPEPVRRYFISCGYVRCWCGRDEGNYRKTLHFI